MNLKQKIATDYILLDGAMGTQLQRAGLPLGALPEEWNITNPSVIEGVHLQYLNAGSDVIYANTFGANPLKFGERYKEVIAAGVRCAKNACAKFKNRYVALDVGSLGKLLKPLGELEFEEAVQIFKKVINAGAEAGADLIAIETMNDCYELKAAVIAAKETCDLPIFATMVFGGDEKTMTGTSPEAFALLAQGLGVDALGLNCSLAPAQMAGVVRRILALSNLPVIVKPNAGLPQDMCGRTVYSLNAKDFASDMQKLIGAGVRIVGGCCGTDGEYIKLLGDCLRGRAPEEIEQKRITAVTSYANTVMFGNAPVLIGERINPTGKKRLKQALKEGDIAYVLNEAVSEEERGAQVLDVNVGLPEIDEAETLVRCIKEIQAVTALPLQIDTSDPVAMEKAIRVYNGVPLINSVNGKEECMRAIFPLVKKYGGVVICLTLDENGIPATADGRIKIAEKIIKTAQKYGIVRGQLIFDTLAMAVSADQTAALAALNSLEYIRRNLGCNTSLGVSNISFGLPQRDFINSTFFAMALARGLSAAIINPNSQEMIKTYKSFLALAGYDKNCVSYVEYASRIAVGEIKCEGAGAAIGAETGAGGNSQPQAFDGDLKNCIIKGLKEQSERAARLALENNKPLEVIDKFIIPALDEVGKGFENKTVFLPQLLMSAEAAGAAFGQVKLKLNPAENAKNLRVVLATVKGDIHDIGKNIVSTMLSNYGFNVHDLGRDVPAEEVVAAAKKYKAGLVGLSALMTTTVVSMKETVQLLHRELPEVKVCVGGAVLTAEYAQAIGADRYCKDAMETVRYAEQLEAGK